MLLTTEFIQLCRQSPAVGCSASDDEVDILM